MARSNRLIVVGAGGVFGRLLARELCQRSSAEIVLAGRDTGTLESLRRALPARSNVSTLRLDLSDLDAVTRVAEESRMILCMAGPFQSLDPRAAHRCVEEGSHWLDISDDPVWTLGLLRDRALDSKAREKNVAVISGLSTLPAISCSLVRHMIGAEDQDAEGVRRALRVPTSVRSTLFIGNRNAKGTAAMASALSGTASIQRITIPFGPFNAFPLSVPDRELLAEDPGIQAEAFVAFESPLASLVFRILRSLALSLLWRKRIAAIVSPISPVISRFGTDRSCLQVETFAKGQRSASLAVLARGQRLAVLPILFAALRLGSDGLAVAGCIRADAFAADLVDFLRREGIEFWSEGRVAHD